MSSSDPDASRDLLLIVGPESSATRLFLEVLSGHPAVKGNPHAVRDHRDALDEVWNALGNGDMDSARARLAELPDRERIATRRSLPHGARPGAPASYLRFPDLEGFADLCRQAGRPLTFLVTTRSAAANLASWTLSRDSTAGRFERAVHQYQAAYRAIFRAIEASDRPFYLLSYEALSSEGEAYVRSLWTLLGLPDAPAPVRLMSGRNEAGYRWLRAGADSAAR